MRSTQSGMLLTHRALPSALHAFDPRVTNRIGWPGAGPVLAPGGDIDVGSSWFGHIGGWLPNNPREPLPPICGVLDFEAPPSRELVDRALHGPPEWVLRACRCMGIGHAIGHAIGLGIASTKFRKVQSASNKRGWLAGLSHCTARGWHRAKDDCGHCCCKNNVEAAMPSKFTVQSCFCFCFRSMSAWV